MGILDDAIREHLELKRQHGAGGEDLRRIEDEAFGPAGEEDFAPSAGAVAMPDEAAEAPTQFLQTEPPPPSEAPADGDEDQAGEQDAMEHRVIEEVPERQDEPKPQEDPEPAPSPEPDREARPLTEATERRAISEQPTELYDVAAELSAGAESPSSEELYEAEAGEPRLAPPEPVGGELEVTETAEEKAAKDAEEGGDQSDMGAEAELALADEEDFFDEQSLSDELDQALDAPDLSMPEATPPPASAPPAPDPEGAPDPERVPDSDRPQEREPLYDQGEEEDVLEETPDFLQDTPEHDRLWFEQKPPKDFDFDD